MKFMLLIYQEEKKISNEERESCYEESFRLIEDISAKKQFLAAAPLHPTNRSTSVRIRDGKRLVTDGPFAETREQLGGYYLVETRNVDEAIEIAARIPGARYGTVEVRPLIELTGRDDSNT